MLNYKGVTLGDMFRRLNDHPQANFKHFFEVNSKLLSNGIPF